MGGSGQEVLQYLQHPGGWQIRVEQQRVLLKPCNPHNHRLETFLAALVPGPLLLLLLLPSHLHSHVTWVVWGLCGI